MKKISFILFTTLTFFTFSEISAQIGFGTETPRGALEVSSSTNGLVLPQVALTSTAVSAPVVNPQTAGAPVTGTLVYNTATAGAGATAVTPGYYFWDGVQWIRERTGTNNDWSTIGNAGTVAGTDFVGTSSAIDFRIKTNSTDRWNISNTNTGQLQSYSLGTVALPIYSFQTDQDTGIFSPAADFLAASTAGTERMRIESDGDVAIGNTLPGHRLHITNNADSEGVLKLDNGISGGFSGVYFYQAASYRGHFGYVNTGGASSFGGKGAYQLAAGNRPIVFSTATGSELFTERMVIAVDGRVGIKTNQTSTDPTVQPTSTLQVRGSFAVKPVTVSATSVLSDSACKVIVSNGATDITITLPDPTTCTGRLLSFARDTGSTGVITLDPTGSVNIQNLSGTVTETTTIALHSAAGAGLNIQFWSDGTIWYR
ncbi:hypothetical protein [Flavobacterium sp. GT3R68]|uniref:hypothetical protein n=1 Tax=Flavobacterium sp. GT3R68 TaxID=2594437 RepID=UPI000F875701|nr:hypothetical protein [Flavobacterium sp. GT3R68]RTY90238.1 hypothetical protein EKL32_21455 [Flavobacterium sp. GSN2]TRW90539.1 hypothetical protein FNW07_10960 [Flavobacterium sp. GT3R68]